MIIKNADSKDAELAELEALMARTDARQQKLIAEQLRKLQAGIRGEQKSAYLLNFALEQSKFTAVIHDLRLELSGRVAQIDHLVIHHTHRFYVLETKSFASGIKITEEGEFLRWDPYAKNFEGMASPIEQNRRHAMVLREMLERLGYKEPKIECLVLVSPEARIDRPAGKRFSEVIKADQFLTTYQKDIESSLNSIGGFISGISKALLGERPEVLAAKLVQMHRPIKFDYASRFGLPEPTAALPKLVVSSVAAVPKVKPQPAEIKNEWGRNAGPHDTKSSPKHHVQCKACQGNDLSIAYGKFGYFFKCNACDGNTAIKISCGQDGHKERIRKDGPTFYRKCADCGTSSVYFVNNIV